MAEYIERERRERRFSLDQGIVYEEMSICVGERLISVFVQREVCDRRRE